MQFIHSRKACCCRIWSGRNVCCTDFGKGRITSDRPGKGFLRGTASKDVALFRQTGKLSTESNIQFGEGGAGTFSDGKLTTGIKDFRIRYVLQNFVAFGAPEEILYLAKPHIGTDKLVHIVREIRKEIIKYGGEIHFQARMQKFAQKDHKLTAIYYEKDGELLKFLHPTAFSQ